MKGAIRARGRVLKSTLVADKKQTVHDVHAYTVAFSFMSLDQVKYLFLSSTDAHAP